MSGQREWLVRPKTFRAAQQRLEEALGRDVMLRIAEREHLTLLTAHTRCQAEISVDGGETWSQVCQASHVNVLLRRLERATYGMAASS